MRKPSIAVTLLLLGTSWAAAAQPLVLRNEKLEVSCQPAEGRFTIGRPGAKQPVVIGKLAAGGGTGAVVKVADKAFGPGETIEVRSPDGNVEQISLYPHLRQESSFVIFRSSRHNSGSQPMIIPSRTTMHVTLDLGKPASALRALGTGGLATLDSKPGSYMWMAVADPETRRGVVAGWITCDRGCGVLRGDVANYRPEMKAQLDYGKLRIPPGKTAEMETLAIGLFDDSRLGLEAWADAVAQVYAIKLPPQPVGYCTWYHAGAWNEKGLAEQAAFAGEHLKPFGFSVIQIDDGWQDGQTRNGPLKNFTRVRPKGPYASGMKATADAIRAHGLVPGLWFMPFAGTWDDPWYAKHQDWFVKRANGKPYDTSWGGTSCRGWSMFARRSGTAHRASYPAPASSSAAIPMSFAC